MWVKASTRCGFHFKFVVPFADGVIWYQYQGTGATQSRIARPQAPNPHYKVTTHEASQRGICTGICVSVGGLGLGPG